MLRFLFPLLLLAVGFGWGGVLSLGGGTAGPFPIYVTVVMHTEDPPTNPDFTQDRDTYLVWREALLEFAELLHEYGAAFDYQCEWTFPAAAAVFDEGDITADTGGMNILRYLHDVLGVSVDPHAHERIYNYADVAEFIRRLGVEPSQVVGGFLYWPPENRQNWERFREPLRGRRFPEAIWTGRILWGAGTAGHKGPDLFASGVWRPKDRYHFITHDPESPLIYIGSWRRATMRAGGLFDLLDLARRGELDPEGMYTVSIFVAHGVVARGGEEFRERFAERVLEPIMDLEREGFVRWATLPEIARIWIEEYKERPTIYIPADQRGLIRSLFPGD